MADAHKNFATSLIATAPSPAASGTSLVVTAGEGTRFPAPPFNATVWPAGAQPTPANAEIIRVSAISTDTFTHARTQEGTSARTIVVGDQIAATITAKTLGDTEGEGGALRRTGCLYETFSRRAAPIVTTISPLASQRLSMWAIELPSGIVITSITFLSGTTALATGVNQLFGLYDDSAGASSGTAYALLRGSTDGTSGAWAANAEKTLSLTSTYTTTRAGLFYLGLLVNATTVPQLTGIASSAAFLGTLTPVLAGTANTGVTALPNPASAPSGLGSMPYAYVS